MVHEQDDELSPLDQEVAQELGPVVFHCRRRSKKDIQTSLTGEAAGSYIGPFFIGLFSLLGFGSVAGLVSQVDSPLPRPVNLLVIGLFVVLALLAFPISTGVAFWWTFRRPRNASLVIHRDGFREGQVRAPYADIAKIWIGKEPSKRDRGAMALGRFAESTLGGLVIGHARHQIKENAKVAEASRKATVLLQDTDGKMHALTNLLVHYEANDLARFFSEIRRRCPALAIVGDVPVASSPESS